MAALRSTERATLGRRALQSVRRISGDQYQSFRLIVYLAISVFVLLYVFTVKGNQPTLRGDIELLQLEAFPPSGDDGQQGPRPGGGAPTVGK